MIYTLMNKNNPVFQLELDHGDVLWVGNPMRTEYRPISIEDDDGIINRRHTADWLKNRAIPASRDNLFWGLSNLGYVSDNTSPVFLLERNFCLSLSDQYWLKPDGSDIEWKDINYFDNAFSEDVGKAFFDNQRIETPDLNSPCNSSDGWLRKKWSIIDSKRCLVKGSSGVYQQEAYNEVIACEICRMLGINHAEYSLKTSQSHSYSICETFINSDTELISANEILKAFLPNSRKSIYDHFVSCCERLGVPETEKSLDEIIVLDYIIGNKDRHLRNFGVIRDVNNLSFIGFSPVFDSGTSIMHNVPTQSIDSNEDIKSIPFAAYHSEQIKYIKNADRFDLSKLKNIPDFAREIFSRGTTIDKERAFLLSEVLKTRIGNLDKALCKGYTQGLDNSIAQNKG